MDLEIVIDKRDVSFGYDSIKSLLNKLHQIEQAKHNLKSLKLIIKADKEDFTELGVAIIWRYALLYKSLECRKEIISSIGNDSFFRSRHFFDRLTTKGTKLKSFKFNPNIPIHFETFTPIRGTTDSASEGKRVEDIFTETIRSLLDSKVDFHRELRVQISEILNNAFDHSELQADAGAVCTKNSNGMLSFCVVDMGQGFKKSFLSNPALKEEYARKPDEEVIKTATELRASCNPPSNRHPNYVNMNGGIGLFFLKEFIKLHSESFLVIVSNKGYFYIDSTGREKVRNLNNTEWPGSIVYFRTRLRNEKDSRYNHLTQVYLEESGLLSPDDVSFV